MTDELLFKICWYFVEACLIVGQVSYLHRSMRPWRPFARLFQEDL